MPGSHAQNCLGIIAHSSSGMLPHAGCEEREKPQIWPPVLAMNSEVLNLARFAYHEACAIGTLAHKTSIGWRP